MIVGSDGVAREVSGSLVQKGASTVRMNLRNFRGCILALEQKL